MCGIARSRWRMYSSRRVAQHHRVAAREDDVADLGVLARGTANADSYCLSGIFSGIAHLAAPRAEAAVARADRAHEEEGAIRIAVRDVRHRRVAVLVERVDHAVDDLELLDGGDELVPVRVADLLDLRERLARDAHLEVVERGLEGLDVDLPFGHVLAEPLGDVRSKFLERADALVLQNFLPVTHRVATPPSRVVRRVVKRGSDRRPGRRNRARGLPRCSRCGRRTVGCSRSPGATTSRRRADDHHGRSSFSSTSRTSARPMPRPCAAGSHGEPVEVVRAVGGRRGAEAGVADELLSLERADELVVDRWRIVRAGGRAASATWARSNSDERDLDLVGVKGAGVHEQLGETSHGAAGRSWPMRIVATPRPANRSSPTGSAARHAGEPLGQRPPLAPSSTPSRERWSPSSQTWRTSAPYSMPATRAIRARPASGAMSGFAFTSRIHGRPRSSMRMSTRP